MRESHFTLFNDIQHFVTVGESLFQRMLLKRQTHREG